MLFVWLVLKRIYCFSGDTGIYFVKMLQMFNIVATWLIAVVSLYYILYFIWN